MPVLSASTTTAFSSALVFYFTTAKFPATDFTWSWLRATFIVVSAVVSASTATTWTTEKISNTISKTSNHLFFLLYFLGLVITKNCKPLLQFM